MGSPNHTNHGKGLSVGTIRDLMIRLGVEVDVEEGMNKATELFKSGGARMVAGATVLGAAVGAELSKAFAGAIEVEAANDKLAAQMGLTGQDAERAGKIAGELYGDAYGESLGEVNEAIKNVSFNIKDMSTLSDADLKSITAGAMDIAKAFDQDVGNATRAVGKLMSTGLAPDAQSAMDMITKAFQSGADQGGDLLDTINEYSIQFKKLGIDGPVALGLLSQGLQGGARDADIVADAFKEFSLRAIDGSTLTADSFKLLGMDGKKMGDDIAAGGSRAFDATRNVIDAINQVEDPVKRNAIAVGLFGTQAEDLGSAFQELDLTTAASQGGIEGFAGATAQLGQTLADNTQTRVVEMQRAFEHWTQSLIAIPGPMGETSAALMAFGPQALTIAGSLGMIVSGFGGIAVAAARATGQAIVSFSTMVASGTAASAKIIGQLVLQGAQWLMLGTQSLLQAARVAAAWVLAMGPIGWVIAAVVALVALIIANWDTIKNAIAVAWEWIKEKTMAVWNAVTSWLSGIWTSIVNTAKSIWNGITSFFTGLWNGIKSAVDAAWNWILDKIKWYINMIIAGIKVIQSIVAWVRDVFNKVKTAIQTAWDAAIAFIKTIPSKITSALGNLGNLLVQSGKNIVMGLWNGIKSMGSWLYDQVSGFVGGIVDSVKNFFGISSPAKKMIPLGKFTMMGFGLGITRSTKAVVGMAMDSASSIASAFTEPLSGAMSVGLTGGGPELAPTYSGPTAPTYGPATGTMGTGAGNVYIQNVNLSFADDRDLYEKGQETARGLMAYKARGGVIPSP